VPRSSQCDRDGGHIRYRSDLKYRAIQTAIESKALHPRFVVAGARRIPATLRWGRTKKLRGISLFSWVKSAKLDQCFKAIMMRSQATLPAMVRPRVGAKPYIDFRPRQCVRSIFPAFEQPIEEHMRRHMAAYGTWKWCTQHASPSLCKDSAAGVGFDVSSFPMWSAGALHSQTRDRENPRKAAALAIRAG